MNDFRGKLAAEFARRRRVNGRYSLRAFAKWLETDHSTLSQVMRGRRAVPQALIARWCVLHGMGPEEAAVHAAQAASDLADLAARNASARWLGEAQAMLANDAHWRMLLLLRTADFQADTRWIAARLGRDVDTVNEALSRLLRLGLVTIDAGGWHDASGLAESTAERVKEVALARLRLA